MLQKNVFVLIAFEPVKDAEKEVEEANDVEDPNEEDDQEDAAEESSDSVGKTIKDIYKKLQACGIFILDFSFLYCLSTRKFKKNTIMGENKEDKS